MQALSRRARCSRQHSVPAAAVHLHLRAVHSWVVASLRLPLFPLDEKRDHPSSERPTARASPRRESLLSHPPL